MSEVLLSGIGEAIRHNALRAGGLALTAALLVSCGIGDDEGVVYTGADGQQYVLPQDAERPLYRSKEDCIADVTDQINALRDEGVEVTENPADLCEDSTNYHHTGTSAILVRGWYGPILSNSSRWESNRVVSWEPVTNGSFAAPGAKLQSGIERAPVGAVAGERVTIKGGFGSVGKSGGFGRSVAA